jgi:hypothetical protein
MSAILPLEALISSIAAMARPATSPPRSACSRAPRASWLAWLAFSAFCFQARGLLLRTLAEIVVAAGDFLRGGIDRLGSLAHFTHDRAEAVVHGAERVQQLAQFVVAAGLDFMPEVALGDGVRHFHRAAQRAGDRADQQHGDDQGQQQATGQRDQRQGADLLVAAHLRLEDFQRGGLLRLHDLGQRGLAHQHQRAHLHVEQVGRGFVLVGQGVEQVLAVRLQVAVGRGPVLVELFDLRRLGQCGELLLQRGDVSLRLVEVVDLLLHLVGLAHQRRRLAQRDVRHQRALRDGGHQVGRHHLAVVDLARAVVLHLHRAEADDRAANQHDTEQAEHADEAGLDAQRGHLGKARHECL